jgi:O-antigen/teichoic acid export membrane protein
MADEPDSRREASGALALDETGRRAASGAALLVARGGVGLVLGLAANVGLARLLTPRDFGLVALGTVLVVFATFLSEGGLAAGLIRRAEAPTRAELEAVNALQLAATAAATAVGLAIGAAVGRDGLVVAVMLTGLPITMLKVPSVIVLERRLDYRPIATVDIVEAVAFYGWALGSVALGAGVWGFATAVVARSLAGALTMLLLGPAGFVRPRWSWRALRPLLGFGAKFQAATVIALVRDQALNIGIASIAGVATLGVWNLAWRVLQIPFVIFGAFGRVGFPAMARVLGAGQDPRPVIERGGAALSVLSGMMGIAVVGFAPALPVVLGPGWNDVPAVLLWAGVTLIANLPIVLGSASYLFAADAGGTVVVAAVVGAVLWLGVTLPLVSSLGAPAAGIGWFASALVQLTLLVTRTGAHSGAAVARNIGVPVAIAMGAAAAGWLVADAAGRTVAAGLLGAAAGEAILLGALLVVRRSALRDIRGVAAQALGGFLRGPAPPAQP